MLVHWCGPFFSVCFRLVFVVVNCYYDLRCFLLGLMFFFSASVVLVDSDVAAVVGIVSCLSSLSLSVFLLISIVFNLFLWVCYCAYNLVCSGRRAGAEAGR